MAASEARECPPTMNIDVTTDCMVVLLDPRREISGESGPGSQQSVERCVSPLRVRMREIVSAECDDLSIALHGRQVIFVAMVAQEPLHEPGLGVMGIDVENSVEKDLSNVPAFFGYCAGDVTPVDADHRIVARGLVSRVRLEKADRQHACHRNDDEV